MANEYFQRTPTSTGNRSVYTWAGWVKINELDLDKYLFSSGDDTSNIFYIILRTDSNNNNFTIIFRDGDTTSHSLVFDDNSYRDPSSWIHLVVAVDTTITTPTQDRVKVYINGKRLINPTTDQLGNLNANSQTSTNALELHTIGDYSVSSGTYAKTQIFDYYLVDGQALTPDVFGFYKEGKGYQSSGSTQATDFRPGQWVPKAPRTIKTEINRRGGFGVNGFYLPMNDSSNFGADFHCAPNSIIKLKGEDLPQPQNGAPTTTDSYVSQLRSDPYAANLVLAVPGISGGTSSGYGDYSADIKGSGSNKTLTANGNAGVAVTASYYGSALSFDGTGDYFSIPNTSDFRFTSEDFTIEAWIKTNDVTDDQFIFSNWNGTDNRRAYTLWIEQGTPRYAAATDGTNSNNGDIDPGNAVVVYNDEWAHVAMSREGSTNRVFLNGVCVGINTTGADIYDNTVDTPLIGGEGGTGTREFNGYIQDLRVYKGVAKYKGGFDVPKPYTPVGIATWRAVPDTTANNFATLNPLQTAVNLNDPGDFTDGNLTVTYDTSTNHGTTTCNVGIGTTGKWYAEARVNSLTESGGFSLNIGITGIGRTNNSAAVSFNEVGVGYRADGGEKRVNTTGVGGGTESAYGSSYTTGDIIGIGVSNGDLTFYKNGVSQGIAYTGITTVIDNNLTDDLFFGCGDYASAAGGSFTWNFGQNPTFSGNTTAGTYTDSNGKGLFKYQPPSGFLALCEDNLPTPAIADPGEHFKTVIWTGDGNTGRSITDVGFKPDFVWIKKRSGGTTRDSVLFDTVRGAANQLKSSQTQAESYQLDELISFDDDGFSVGSGDNPNGNGNTYVAWCWKAGGSSNTFNVDGTGYATASAAGITDGSIALTAASVNTTAGFSIVSYTSNGTSGATVGHHLNKTPSFIIVKMRSSQAVGSADWAVYHKSLGATKNVWLNATNSENTSSAYWNNTEPTSSVFSLGNDLDTNHTNGYDYIAYCFAEVEGFSKFGNYVGNGSADGPFVYCGFKPAFVMTKSKTVAGSWQILDSTRNTDNPCNNALYANLNNDESVATGNTVDFLSNGFKLRGSNATTNQSGQTYIFMAFAEAPFKYANAK